MAGKLEKLKIKAIENGQPTTNPELIYDALVNPESYKVRLRIQYNPEQPPQGTTGQDQQFARALPPDLQLDFIFDSTGVIPQPLEGIAGALSGVPIAGAVASALAGPPKYDILADIAKFKRILYDFDGTTHTPRQIQIVWGALLFNGVMASIDFNFKLFKPSGEPIRVVATTSFSGTIEDDLRVALEQKSSPDLTHIREVKEGDTLPLMSFRIYGDAAYYLEVAKANNLVNFRNIPPGTKIFFPPVEKSKASIKTKR